MIKILGHHSGNHIGMYTHRNTIDLPTLQIQFTTIAANPHHTHAHPYTLSQDLTIPHQTLSQSPSTALAADKLSDVRTEQRNCLWPLGNSGNSDETGEPTIHCDRGNPNQYLNRPITKRWCQPLGGHVSYPIYRPTATRLGLCSSVTPILPQGNSVQ